jgi:hypothetical protein
MASVESSGWIRRQALNIASQLPEEADSAREIIALVQRLIDFFDVPDPPPDTPGDQAVLRFPGGPNSPRRRASSTGRPSGLPK